MSRESVIEPDDDFNASIPRMKAIPETCPTRSRSPFDVPSGAGCVISAPYWNPRGPDERRNAPRTKLDASKSP
jgi:hypothetical protein